jgi:hypothetical protein
VRGEVTWGPQGGGGGVGDRRPLHVLRHARLRVEGGRLWVTDLDSKNRTYSTTEPLPPHEARPRRRRHRCAWAPPRCAWRGWRHSAAMDLLNWLLRAILLALGAGAAVWILRWPRGPGERRGALAGARRLGMLLLAAALRRRARAAARAARSRSRRGGRSTPLRRPAPTELRRAEVRGWILDCTGATRARSPATASATETVERPTRSARRAPTSSAAARARRSATTPWSASSPRAARAARLSRGGQLHPAGTDSGSPSARRHARAPGSCCADRRPGAVVVQDVATGAWSPTPPPAGRRTRRFGIRRYAPPGSVFKLALAALWWESGLPDEGRSPAPRRSRSRRAPHLQLRRGRLRHGERAGGDARPLLQHRRGLDGAADARAAGRAGLRDAYRRYGFEPYADQAAARHPATSGHTASRAWARRMSPPPRGSDLRADGPAEWAQLAIGQGPVDVTVIGVSRFLQAIGNGGVMLPPTLEWELAERPARGRRVMSEATASGCRRRCSRWSSAAPARSARRACGDRLGARRQDGHRAGPGPAGRRLVRRADLRPRGPAALHGGRLPAGRRPGRRAARRDRRRDDALAARTRAAGGGAGRGAEGPSDEPLEPPPRPPRAGRARGGRDPVRPAQPRRGPEAADLRDSMPRWLAARGRARRRLLRARALLDRGGRVAGARHLAGRGRGADARRVSLAAWLLLLLVLRLLGYRGNWAVVALPVIIFLLTRPALFQLFTDPVYQATPATRAEANALKAERSQLTTILRAYDEERQADRLRGRAAGAAEPRRGAVTARADGRERGTLARLGSAFSVVLARSRCCSPSCSRARRACCAGSARTGSGRSCPRSASSSS